MKIVSRQVVRHARVLAREIGAQAVLLYADALQGDEELWKILQTIDYPTIVISRATESIASEIWADCTVVEVPDVHMTRIGQIKIALLVSLAKGFLHQEDTVVCLSGLDRSSFIDTFMVLNLGTETELFTAAHGFALENGAKPEVFERILSLTTQLAVEGREGRPVGVIFVLGDSDTVLRQSRNLVLNPFQGYPEAERNILDTRLEETIKEYAALDGAFVVRGDGVVLTAGTQLLPNAPPLPLPKGLGTRHAAAAAITASTRALAITVSQSTGTLSVFKAGRMVTDIHRPVNGSKLAL
jgi:diadenylate cyclase